MMKSGLWLPDTARAKEQMAQTVGYLVAKGGDAFEDWKEAPEIGDQVYFAKYAGYVVKGKDGIEYRLCNDKDIAAIIR
jgi:co-chaperonin GroES (HSP10)